MIQPLFALVFGEVFVILLLLFRTPLRNPLLLLLDRSKQGRGPVVASTAGVTLFVVMASLLINITSIGGRSEEGGGISPTDQVILAYQLLQASLLGFALFLGLMIDRIHYYIKEVRMLRKHLEAVKKMDKKPQDAKGKGKASDDEEDE
ncbi:hypothetical protein M569_11771 [Genlisea aurea]|uniref:Endoplasmic reticulum transmembrane protein n=1 Tax=Genlisea aurea TaxID=192259 RepID=S8DJH6_9LAMI|nr:hypothetical protein M569_11771 [Genlisea aurea]